MTERRSRFVRGEDPANLLLTERDVEIIRACYDYRWLTRPQLQHLVALPHVGRCNDRLRRLFDQGYLDRIRAGTIGAGLQPVYVAGDAAVPLLASYTGLGARKVRSRLREDRHASPVLLPHDLQVNDVRMTLLAGLSRHPEVRLDTWLHAADAFDRYHPSRFLRPDGYCRFWCGEWLHAFYLEVDRGTTNPPRWRQKVERYLEYRTAGHYTQRFGLTRFRVLTTVPSPERLQQLATVTGQVTDRGFWFALTDAVIRNPDPVHPMWQPVGEQPRRPLISETGGR